MSNAVPLRPPEMGRVGVLPLQSPYRHLQPGLAQLILSPGPSLASLQPRPVWKQTVLA